MARFSTAATALRGPFKKLIAKLALTLTKVLIRKPGKRSYPAPAAAKDAVERDLRDPSSLRGATPEEVRRLIPEDWLEKPLRKGEGTWAAIEDYAGLWTAPWELRALHPEPSSQELRGRARGILVRFLEGGLIHLYSCREPDGEPILIDDVRAGEILEAEESWDEPAEDWLVTLFSATPEGEAAYKGMF